MKIIRKILLCLAVLMSVSFAESMVTQAAETQDNVQTIKENEEVSGVHIGGSLHKNKYSFYIDENVKLKFNLSLTPGADYYIFIYDKDENIVDGKSITAKGNDEYVDIDFITSKLKKGNYILTISTVENNISCSFKLKYYKYGFVEEENNGKLKYYDENGIVKGWHKLTGDLVHLSGTYYFDDEGYAVDGLQTINGKVYYFSKYRLQPGGWKIIDGSFFYFSEDGYAVNGWQEIENDTYYFKDYNPVDGFQYIDGDLYYFSLRKQVKYDYKFVYDHENDCTYYFINGKAVNGVQNIDDKIYYFKDFKLIWGLYSYNGDWYYLDTNLQKNIWFHSDNGTYYFGNDYKAVNGLKEINGHLYYFKDFKMQNGIQCVEGNYYYFNPYALEGTMNGYIFGNDYKAIKDGFVMLGSNYYYVDNYSYQNGGFKTINGDTYYFSESNDYAAENGWLHLSNGSYYFDNYKMVTGIYKIGDSYYIFENDGRMKEQANGWYDIDGNLYYFVYGDMQKDCWVDGRYLDENGIWNQAKGKGAWIQEGIGWLYMHNDGSYTTNNFEEINGQIYYFNGSGYRQTDWQFIDSKWYYFNDLGVMLKDTWFGEYLLDENGVWQQGVFKVKWIQDGNGWWYRHSDGGYTSNNFEVIDGKTYYFNGSGYMQTGWQFINKKWYYFNGSGAMLKDTWFGEYLLDENGVWQQGVFKVKWIQDSTGWWYRHSDGGYTSNNFEVIDGKTYYFNGSGYMQTGWQFIDKKWYYFEGSGAMLKDTWFGEYLLDENGVWQQGVFKIKWIQDSTGWWYRHSDGGYTSNNFEEIDGKTYYFNGSGYMQTGWQFINSKWYYFNGSGEMLKNTYVDGYWLDENGVWK